MKETYLTQFMSTGSVADYLNYKMVEKSAADTKCDKNGTKNSRTEQKNQSAKGKTQGRKG